ncbi:hypothetical protein HU200_007623 [Digitaria exilis]|uniref:LysM domain-containing protein n=1 Tax=Digitaria exilis TaxID=1010633 RepID=A0A835KQQ0_9POAL|nr:hypothetical protein HU200_007623 [Digitaria exilis]
MAINRGTTALAIVCLLIAVTLADALPPAFPLVCDKVYGVQKHETCFAVSQAEGLSLKKFLRFNPNINCDNLFIGQSRNTWAPTYVYGAVVLYGRPARQPAKLLWMELRAAGRTTASGQAKKPGQGTPSPIFVSMGPEGVRRQGARRTSAVQQAPSAFVHAVTMAITQEVLFHGGRLWEASHSWSSKPPPWSRPTSIYTQVGGEDGNNVHLLVESHEDMRTSSIVAMVIQPDIKPMDFGSYFSFPSMAEGELKRRASMREPAAALKSRPTSQEPTTTPEKTRPMLIIDETVPPSTFSKSAEAGQADIISGEHTGGSHGWSSMAAHQQKTHAVRRAAMSTTGSHSAAVHHHRRGGAVGAMTRCRPSSPARRRSSPATSTIGSHDTLLSILTGAAVVPMLGYDPTEDDTDEDVANGPPEGIATLERALLACTT